MPTKVKAYTAKMKKRIAKAAMKLGIAPDFSEGGGKTYEAWVLLELASRVRPAITVSARDHTGALTTAFRVRGAPGYIPSVSSSSPAPCHFLLEGPKHQAELHSSLRHRGASGDTHELDVSAVDPVIAEYIRQNHGGPFSDPFGSHTMLGVELKEYDGAQSLPKVYARALVGVSVDLNPYTHVVVQRRHQPHSSTLGLTDFWLLTTTTLGTSHRLLDHHDIGWRENVAPGSGMTQLQAVADALKARLS